MECDKSTGTPDDRKHLLNTCDKSDNSDIEMKQEEENSKGGGSKEKSGAWESGMETNQDDLLMLEVDPGESSRQGSMRGGDRKGSPENMDIRESQKENMAGVKTLSLTNQRVKVRMKILNLANQSQGSIEKCTYH
jgi:hypothetical protein